MIKIITSETPTNAFQDSFICPPCSFILANTTIRIRNFYKKTNIFKQTGLGRETMVIQCDGGYS
jgi:hypothetical protein